MLGVVEIGLWHYVAFIAAVLVFVALDLFVFHRKATVITFREALLWTSVTVVLALLFGGMLVPMRGKPEALEFITGYIIELALSMDNVFVIALIFGYFRVPSAYQHRVLFFGFINALIMRGTVIGLGTALVQRFHFVLYILGALLVFSGVKMMFSREGGVHPEKNPLVKLAQKFFPIASNYDGAHFLTRVNGARALTPLALVLLMIETTDLVFAIDSIPAIFSVTQKPFIVFTSNIFAILGLRSLYFVLVGAIELFHYLKYGLSLVLIFVGLKMVGEMEVIGLHISTGASLLTVAALIGVSIGASVVLTRESPPPPLAPTS